MERLGGEGVPRRGGTGQGRAAPLKVVAAPAHRLLWTGFNGLDAAAVRPGGVVLIADPDRSLGRDFLREAGENGFHVTSRRSREEHGGRTTNVVISELKAPAS